MNSEVWSLTDLRHHSAQYGMHIAPNKLEAPQMKYTPIGVDIAKHLFQIHYINEYTGEVVDKRVKRADFLTFFSNR